MGHISFLPAWKSLFFLIFAGVGEREGARHIYTAHLTSDLWPQAPHPAASPCPTKPCHLSLGRTEPRGKAGWVEGAVGTPSCSQM